MTPTRDELLTAYAFADRTSTRVRMNFIESADGAVTLGGESAALGGGTDHALMQVLRTLSDVVVVGAGTVRAEGYGSIEVSDEDATWRRANGLAEQPRLAVVSNRLELDPIDPVFAEPSRRPVVVTHADAPPDRRRALEEVADVVVCGEASVDLHEMLAELTRRGLTQVLCEGGPHLFGALLDAGRVDEVCVTIAPRFVGGEAGRIAAGASEADRRFALASVLTDDEGFVFLRYARA
ncbi:pyrimidine reductase family protein [Microbacterium sp. 4R-513]|uniref:pyrimidine reductase family protein n=1 Tax=Microbacterium sp. 4R-513 TaxID=2567934 RepID=UPI0013E16C8E|nr:pyrimidine reductase family protein [Microbacterium sp. 4R-513]QIG40020.1 pyrimidine reductase family protein [Microbacterium sp. 4R-513]